MLSRMDASLLLKRSQLDAPLGLKAETILNIRNYPTSANHGQKWGTPKKMLAYGCRALMLY